jgi:hypothetical protein
MQTDDGAQTGSQAGVVTPVVLAVADLAHRYLLEKILFGVVLLSVVVVFAAFDDGGAVSTSFGAAVGLGAATTALMPFLRHWSHSSTWLTLLTVAAVDLGVILVLESR